MATVVELSPIAIDAPDGSSSAARLFRLDLGDVTIELSSLGASITKVLLPNYSKDSSAPGRDLHRDDVVLSYISPKEQHDDKNTQFFGAIVGRVANRIKGGTFQLSQTKSSADGTVVEVETYQLEKNNGPNHLHGGFDGFCHRVWDAQVVDDGVQFTLASPDGDEGYPGGIKVTATYSLNPGLKATRLCLEMRASLLPGETKATPIALAQHSYFNLASHSSRRRILDHTLHLPNCTKYTPLDNTSIPTREVRPVGREGGVAMDFREEKELRDALIQYGEETAGLENSQAASNVHRILRSSETGDDASRVGVAKTPKTGGAPGANLDGDAPYGFDHNYVIDGQSASPDGDSLRLAAVLSHPPTGRSLQVSTTAPGIQLYTSNYLDETSPPPALCKDGTKYGQWQGLCLETQTYPDSISCDEGDAFADGRCFVIRPGGKDYLHLVEYEFRNLR